MADFKDVMLVLLTLAACGSSSSVFSEGDASPSEDAPKEDVTYTPALTSAPPEDDAGYTNLGSGVDFGSGTGCTSIHPCPPPSKM